MKLSLYNEELKINDLMRQAHPGGGLDVLNAPSPSGGDPVVEDNIEKQMKILRMVYKKPVGRVVSQLERDLRKAGADDLAKKVAGILKKGQDPNAKDVAKGIFNYLKSNLFAPFMASESYSDSYKNDLISRFQMLEKQLKKSNIDWKTLSYAIQSFYSYISAIKSKGVGGRQEGGTGSPSQQTAFVKDPKFSNVLNVLRRTIGTVKQVEAASIRGDQRELSSKSSELFNAYAPHAKEKDLPSISREEADFAQKIWLNPNSSLEEKAAAIEAAVFADNTPEDMLSEMTAYLKSNLNNPAIRTVYYRMLPSVVNFIEASDNDRTRAELLKLLMSDEKVKNTKEYRDMIFLLQGDSNSFVRELAQSERDSVMMNNAGFNYDEVSKTILDKSKELISYWNSEVVRSSPDVKAASRSLSEYSGTIEDAGKDTPSSIEELYSLLERVGNASRKLLGASAQERDLPKSNLREFVKIIDESTRLVRRKDFTSAVNLVEAFKMVQAKDLAAEKPADKPAAESPVDTGTSKGKEDYTAKAIEGDRAAKTDETYPVRLVQRIVGVEETGTYDETTHEALGAYLKTNKGVEGKYVESAEPYFLPASIKGTYKNIETIANILSGRAQSKGPKDVTRKPLYAVDVRNVRRFPIATWWGLSRKNPWHLLRGVQHAGLLDPTPRGDYSADLEAVNSGEFDQLLTEIADAANAAKKTIDADLLKNDFARIKANLISLIESKMSGKTIIEWLARNFKPEMDVISTNPAALRWLVDLMKENNYSDEQGMVNESRARAGKHEIIGIIRYVMNNYGLRRGQPPLTQKQVQEKPVKQPAPQTGVSKQEQPATPGYKTIQVPTNPQGLPVVTQMEGKPAR